MNPVLAAFIRLTAIVAVALLALLLLVVVLKVVVVAAIVAAVIFGGLFLYNAIRRRRGPAPVSRL